MNPGDWREEAKKAITNDKEVIINGVCVMNQSLTDGDDDDDVNMDQAMDERDEPHMRLPAIGHDEDEIKKSFIKKPSMEKSSVDNADDVKVKKEIDESGAWEY